MDHIIIICMCWMRLDCAVCAIVCAVRIKQMVFAHVLF